MSENEREELDGKGDIGVITQKETKVTKPPLYKVIMLNDDFTPMEFVVHVLMKFFKKSEAESLKIMLEVHSSGSSIVGVYTREVAESKTHQVNDYSKRYEFPLLCKYEKE